MEFRYEPELLAFMEQKKKKNILVELIVSESSDFDYAELHVRLVSDRIARVYKEDRKYKGTMTEVGEVLLPDYRLEYEPVVTFSLRKGFFKKILQTGISL